MPHSTTITTLGGTLLTVITISGSTIISTIIIATIGAITSFFVGIILKKLFTSKKKHE